MRLEYTTKTVHYIDYSDLEDFVQEIYKIKNYDFVSIQECGNDSAHKFITKGTFSSYQLEQAKQIRDGKISTYQNGVLFECLVADGYLPSGEFIVEVSW